MHSHKKFFELLPFQSHGLFSITGFVSQTGDTLSCYVEWKGNISSLKLNPSLSKTNLGERKEGLWNSNCFEIFVKEATSTAYTEWNFAPTGEWFSLVFSDYRKRDDNREAPHPLHGEWNFTEDSVRGNFHIPLQFHKTDSFQNKQAILVGLSSILLTPGGKPSYWALSHQGSQADFHDFKCFTISFTQESTS